MKIQVDLKKLLKKLKCTISILSELQILAFKLKLKNYNLREISEKLNMPHKKTYLYFDNFRKKFQIYIVENKII